MRAFELLRLLPAVAGSVFPVSDLDAQVFKGQTPPAIEFDKVWNGAPETSEGTAGKVVILDFGATT